VKLIGGMDRGSGCARRMEVVVAGSASLSGRHGGGGCCHGRRMEVAAVGEASLGDRGCQGGRGCRMAQWRPRVEGSRPCLLDRSDPRS
jgi:hypothetical protein